MAYVIIIYCSRFPSRVGPNALLLATLANPKEKAIGLDGSKICV